MKTFLASKGSTSSGATFWLIPAIRRNERIGPGTMNCDEFVTDPSRGEAVSSSDGCQIVESAKSRVLPGKQPQKKANATTRIQIHRGSFTAGFLLEPATTTRNQEYVAES